jgi:hypothetical protein
MATRLQPHLVELVEKKRRELTAAIHGVCKTLTRVQHSLESHSDLAVNEAEDLQRECGVLNRLCAELQTLESVAKVDRESGSLDRRTKQGISKETQKIA